MIHLNRWASTDGVRLMATLCVLGLLSLMGCGDSEDEAAPTPTPQSALFATPPAGTSTGTEDESDIVVELDQTATPYPTSTPYPTATPYPAATPYPVAVSSSESTSGPGPFTPGSPRTPESTTAAPQAGPTIRISIPKKSEVKLPKADSKLNNLVDKVESGEITAEEAAKEAPLHRGESVGVIIILSGNVEGVAAFLRANGASNINAGDDYIEAFVPILLLGQTSEQPGVLRVNQIQPPGETQGTPQVTGEGPGVHGSGPWNDAGYAGQGVKVGVIDRGFSGFAEIMGSEVPATVEARCYIWLGQHSQDPADCSDAGTHGTIVSESVMDIAPEAALYISDPQSLSELRDAVDWMISEGVSVINHSRLWSFDGPGDGTSPLSISPLNSIDRAVAAGIVWVNAAGNQARGTWFKRGPFDYTTVNIDGEEIRFLRFSGSEFRNEGSYIGGRLDLRWSDDWGGADTDLDLFALATGTDIIALQSIDIQSGGPGHNPYEWIGSLATFDILVAHRGGPEPDWIQLVGWGPTRLTLNSTGAGSIVNPAESANPAMLAVGAAPWYNVNVLSGFSSRGPTPDGRIKPDVVAANCGPTATGGEGFCGTSQSSPHVAGLAALVRQRYPDYTPAQVASYLKENAEQRTSPDPNNSWGHGFFVLPPLTQPPPSPTAPGAPGILSLTPGTNSLNVSWRAPLQTGGATITAYDLRHIRSDASSKADGNWTVVRRVWTGAGGLTHVLHSLTGSVQYDVQVRAANSAGDGPWSATRAGTPVSPLVVPGSPIFVTASPVAGSLSVSWSAPPDDGGSAVTSYDLRHIRSDASNKGDANWTVSRRVSSGFGALRYSLTGLVGGTRYDLQVRAVNAVGEGSWSATAIGTPLTQSVCQDSSVVPNASSNPQLVSDCETLLALKDTLRGTGTLNWSASVPIRSWNGVGVGGSPLRVSGFRIQGNMTGRIPSELGNLNGLTLLDLSNNQLTGTIPRALGNLPNLRFLYLQSNRLTGDIPAELGNLSSLEVLYLWSNQLAGTIPPQLSRANSLEELSFSDNRIVGTIPIELGRLANLTSLALARNRLSGSIPAELASLGNLQTLKLSGNQLTGCIPAALRDVLDNDLTGLGLPDCGAATAPGAPTGLTASATGQTQISLSWRAPANDGGGAITGYRIEVSEDRQRWTDQVSNTGSIATNYAHTGLMPGDTRHYRISALNSAGAGQPSAIATGSTAAANVPGAPGVASVTAGKGSLTVTWRAPVQTGGTPVTAYDLRHIRSDAPNKADASWTVVQDVWTGSGALSRELSGLDGGLRFDVQVRAVNSAGDGQWSTTATGTPEATVAIPTPPANAQYRRDGSTAVVTWDPSADATSYKVYHSDSPFPRCSLFSSGTLSGCDELSASVSGTTYTHTNPDGDNDSYWVTACNAAGCSEIDSANPAQFNDTRPSGPTNSHYRLVGTTAVVSWNPSAGATSYKVYHSDSRFPRCSLFSSGTLSGCDELSASVSGTTYTHTSPDTSDNSYWVTACNSGGCSEIDSANPARMEGQGAAPDLVVDAPTVSDNAPAAGARFTLSATVRNQGNARSDSTTLRYYQSIDSTITTGDNGLGTDSVSRLDASESGDESVSLTAPSTPGTYYYGTCVDAVTGEADTTNNCSNGVAVTVGSQQASTCAADGAVSAAANPGLVTDCEKLLAAKDTLRGTASLNWSASIPVENWKGITVSGTPKRVTKLVLSRDRVIGRLNGRLPAELGDLAMLTTLKLSENQLTGTIPPELGNLANLTELNLWDNQLTGAIPAKLGDLSNLRSLILNNNELSGRMPSELGNLQWLETLNLRHNQLTGVIPSELGRLSSLVRIDLLDNSLTGSIPPELGGLQSIEKLELKGNQLTGSIPVELGNLTNLTQLQLNHNQLSGDIPSELGNLINLTELSLHQNGLSGDIPVELGNLTNLQRLNLAGNQLTGCIPEGLLTVQFTDIASLGLPDCYESTPTEATCATGGAVSNAADNPDLVSDCDILLEAIVTLKGQATLNWSPTTPITSWDGVTVEGSPGRVTKLTLTRRGLFGALPPELGDLSKLTYIYISSNNLSGGIPAELSRLTELTTLLLFGNGLTGNIPRELGSLPDLTRLLLNSNELSGAIPSELGNLENLTELNLGWNRLTGEIPSDLGNLSKLERLTLTVNQLTGCVPANLEDQLTSYLFDRSIDFCSVLTSPGAPTGLTATANGQTQIDLSWTAPSDDGGPDIAGYKIEVSADGSSWSDLVADTNSTSTSYSHTGLTAGSTRHYRVSAINSEGTGAASDTDSATTNQATAPDLTVDAPTVNDSTLDAGDSFTLSVTVRNQGNASSDSAKLSYQRSLTDSTFVRGHRIVAVTSMVGLAVSENILESTDLTAPSSPGTYYYRACVFEVSDEILTDNNCSSGVAVTVSAATAPDLVVNTPTVDDSSPTAGESFTLSATVRNQGNGPSGTATLRYYRSSDSTITTSDTEVGTDSVSGLSASGTGDESISLTAPSSAGTYHYGACVDSVSDESDTTNNCSSSVAVTVSAATAPDLTVDRPTVDDSTLETGDSFTLSATVRNGGDASSASTNLRYYRSTDSTITTGDTEVGTDSVSGLSAGDSGDESISLAAPSAAGTYYYGACVDSVSGESDTTNNCSVSVTVTVAAAPEPNPTPTPTPRPTGKAATGSITSCDGEQVAPGIDSYRIYIEGTVTANRAVENVRVEGTFNGSFVGIDIVGDMEAGETASFSVTGYVSESVGTCGADVEWLEIS